MKIAILGAGAWGTALAVSACRNLGVLHQVSLWARDPEQARAMQGQRVNSRYLPGITLPRSLAVHAWPLDAASNTVSPISAAPELAGQDLVVVATPMSALRQLLEELHACTVPVVWLCKGFEEALPIGAQPSSEAPSPATSRQAPRAEILGGGPAFSYEPPALPLRVRPPEGVQKTWGGPASSHEPHGLLAHEVLAQAAPGLRAGVLSGPSFAQEVARGQPTALVAASADPAVRAILVQAFHGPSLRVYASDDIVGVEVGGAVKNVLAIATGLCDGLRLGLNARAALITRGLHEMTRLGVALGARGETFMGLSGLGDLVLTATGDLSRNRKVGLALAQGQTLEQAVQSLGHVAEGVYCARTVVQRAQGLGVDMPIAAAVEALLDGRLSPDAALAALMGREARDES